MVTVVVVALVEGKRLLGVPGEERRATIPPLTDDRRGAFVSKPEESTSVVADDDA